MMTETPYGLIPLIAPGSLVVVRDEEWMVRRVEATPADGHLVHCLGVSSFVRDTEAAFFTKLDLIEPLRPQDATFVPDSSPNFLRSRLFLEAMIRTTPVAATNTDLAVSHEQLLNELQYQRRAVHKALTGLRPRLLIADAVGLGKTLEVGMILSELIRRGQGDKILVVTPRHILEQFQHELWTRFGIPLVRLDSEGIQKVRREIPANRNPFTHFQRAIISIDTLKNAGRYAHHLEGVQWDAVVIDECHNLVNRGTLNNRLARTLAPRTNALLLTSATPHNGDPASFAELINLLDPTAIADPANFKQSDIEHLYVRRHKGHDEVAAEVGSRWAERLEPRPIPINPNVAEAAMFAELADTWTHPVSGTAPVTGRGRSLFPWTLFKAALSSPRALAETIESRRKTLAGSGAGAAGLSIDQQGEDNALERLHETAVAVGDTSSKLDALIDQLTEIGVGPRSDARVVVFSERIATLNWLAVEVPKRLKLKSDQFRVLHGALNDVKQMEVIEEFGQAMSPVRLLLTGDMASEGVNLHRQCHHLIHFDLPWSLITIEQRNGRIDRYGQMERPDIRALIQTPTHAGMTGDVRILARLLEREQEAHRAFGDSGSLLGLHDATAEEEAIMRSLRDGDDVDSVVPSTDSVIEKGGFDPLALLGGSTGAADVPISPTPSLFTSDFAFLEAAMQSVYGDVDDVLKVRRDAEQPDFLSFVPPADLCRRLKLLPQSYLREQKLLERLKITADEALADDELTRARAAEDSMWPQVGHLSPLHPVMSWMADKLLVQLGRNEAPIIIADVTTPVYCVQGSYSNGRGQPQLVEWMAVFETPAGSLMVDDLFTTLDRAGVSERLPNPGTSLDPRQFQTRLDDVIDCARQHLDEQRALHDADVEQRLAEPERRLKTWLDEKEQLSFGFEATQRSKLASEREAIRATTRKLIDQMRTDGQPLIRILAVLAPNGADS